MMIKPKLETQAEKEQLQSAAEDLLNALQKVHSLICEASTTGFNCRSGDWADKLFASQYETYDALKKAGCKRKYTPDDEEID